MEQAPEQSWQLVYDFHRGELRIPFINTSFALDLQIYLSLWPLWWILGLEQLLVPFFVCWEATRYLLQAKWRFYLPRPALWALMLATWWLVPVGWVGRDYLPIFLKETATAWSQALLLLLFWNTVRTSQAWWRIVKGLEILAMYIALGGLIYIAGLWRGEILSLIGRLLPVGLRESSQFLANISFRTLGTVGKEWGVFPYRVSSLAVKFSELSMISLLLIPFIGWRFRSLRGIARFRQVLAISGLLGCLIFAESRMSYFAFGVGLCVLTLFLSGLLVGRNRFLLIATGVVALAFLVAAISFTYPEIGQIYEVLVTNWRPGTARYHIYQETVRLIPEHWVAGWGVARRIPGMPSKFSAGTHSSLLGMLFQHGVVGLVLYIGLWVSIWRVILRGLKNKAIPLAQRSFWIMSTVALLAFNIREMADSWWWDQTLTMTAWTMWGMILTAPRFFQHATAEVELALGHNSGRWLAGK